MARSSLLALCLVLAACSSSVTPVTSARATRAPAPPSYEDASALYADTARTFVATVDAGQFDAAYALIDEHFLFGGDCDYERRNVWSISDRESARNWLQVRIADHDRIDIVRFVDVPSRDHVIGIEIRRSSDSIRAAGYAGGVVRPHVPLIVHFSLDGRRISGFALAWSTPSGSFADCLS